MQSSFLKIFMGINLLLAPTLLNFLTANLVGENNSEFSTFATSITSMLSSMTYVMAAFGVISVAIGLYSLFFPSEYNNSIDNIEEIPIKKEIKSPVNLIKKEKLKTSMSFENEELDTLLLKINEKIKEIKINESLYKNIEIKNSFEIIENKYIPIVYKNYINIPFDLRIQNNTKKDAFTLTKEQLEELYSQLIYIEQSILEDQMYDIKVHNRLIKNKSNIAYQLNN